MTLRRFRIGVAAAALLAGAAAVAWHVAADARARRAARERAAVAAADEVGALLGGGLAPGEAAGAVGRRRGLRIEICGPPVSEPCPPDLLAALRRDEAPRAVPGGVAAPLKDADDWDVIGAVEVGVLHEARRSLVRGSVGWPLLAIAAAALLLQRWGARASARRRRETLTAWSFLGVPAIHLAVCSIFPVLFTGYLAFHRWDLVAPEKPFVGLGNFRELAADPLFWTTLRNTALYVLYVPVTMALALALALLLNRARPGMRLLRAVVFLPYVTSAVAIALVWQWLFNTDFGLINFGLRLAGLPGLDWLGDPRTALPAIILVTIWTQVGYQMVIFLAGLQGIPQSYLDAAVVDGAGRWQRFRHVTLPLLRPVVLFVLVTGIISGFQVFTLVYLMTEGGPLHSTDVLVYRIYQTAWEFLRFGYASAMALVLFGVLLLATVVQFRLLGRRVELS